VILRQALNETRAAGGQAVAQQASNAETRAAALRHLIDCDVELSAQIEAMLAKRTALRKSIGALCPHQPGSVAPSNACHPDEPGFYVDRIEVRDTSGNAEGYEWCLSGRKLTKDGRPHANAWRGDWMNCLLAAVEAQR
jgi:hypothetical protein